MNTPSYFGRLGRKMYSRATLKKFTKNELIDLLLLANENSITLNERLERVVHTAEMIIKDMEKKNGSED